MLCPACKDENLSMTDRQGIEIDYCPKCRGIWLDRGELDRIIERSEREAGAPTTPPAAVHANEEYPTYRRDQHRGDRDHHGSRPRRKKSLLGELFDF